MKNRLLWDFFIKYTCECVLCSLKKKDLEHVKYKCNIATKERKIVSYFCGSTSIALWRLWRNNLHNCFTQNGDTRIFSWNFKRSNPAVDLNRVSVSGSHQSLLWSSRSHWWLCWHLWWYLQATNRRKNLLLALVWTQQSRKPNGLPNRHMTNLNTRKNLRGLHFQEISAQYSELLSII